MYNKYVWRYENKNTTLLRACIQLEINIKQKQHELTTHTQMTHTRYIFLCVYIFVWNIFQTSGENASVLSLNVCMSQ